MYHILFIDGTTNYVIAEEFNGIDLILLSILFWAFVRSVQ